MLRDSEAFLAMHSLTKKKKKGGATEIVHQSIPIPEEWSPIEH